MRIQTYKIKFKIQIEIVNKKRAASGQPRPCRYVKIHKEIVVVQLQALRMKNFPEKASGMLIPPLLRSSSK